MNRFKRGLIIGGGDFDFDRVLDEITDENTFIICADGGMDRALKIGIKPHLVVGDMDSITKEGLNYIHENDINHIRFPVNKDLTDMEIALNRMLSENIHDVQVVSAIGSRWDHSLMNLLLLTKYYHQGMRICIRNNNNSAKIISGRIEIKHTPCYISIIPLDEAGMDITLKGFYYGLNNEHIDFASSRIISNKLLEGHRGIIDVGKGEALLIITKDE